MAETNPYTRDWITITHPDVGGDAEIPESSLPHYESLGWRRLAEVEPPSDATKAELVAWATELDPDNAEAIAAMTKAELREQYGNTEKE